MALFGKMRAKFHDDWCENCFTEMQTMKKQLFYMPQSVGHYTRHEDAAYYIEHLIPVEKKAQIPTGMYACGMYVYRCARCGARYDAEKNELPLMFMRGELDALLERL